MTCTLQGNLLISLQSLTWSIRYSSFLCRFLQWPAWLCSNFALTSAKWSQSEPSNSDHALNHSYSQAVWSFSKVYSKINVKVFSPVISLECFERNTMLQGRSSRQLYAEDGDRIPRNVCRLQWNLICRLLLCCIKWHSFQVVFHNEHTSCPLNVMWLCICCVCYCL
jgi:hypothetical protein